MVSAFNKYLKEFCEKLQRMIPANENIKMVNNMFHVGLVANKEMYIKHFHMHTDPFHTDIVNKNEDIFLSHDFSLIPNLSGYTDHIDEMKEIWESNLPDDHKIIIWQYLKVLSTLSRNHYTTV